MLQLTLPSAELQSLQVWPSLFPPPHSPALFPHLRHLHLQEPGPRTTGSCSSTLMGGLAQLPCLKALKLRVVLTMDGLALLLSLPLRCLELQDSRLSWETQLDAPPTPLAVSASMCTLHLPLSRHDWHTPVPPVYDEVLRGAQALESLTLTDLASEGALQAAASLTQLRELRVERLQTDDAFVSFLSILASLPHPKLTHLRLPTQPVRPRRNAVRCDGIPWSPPPVYVAVLHRYALQLRVLELCDTATRPMSGEPRVEPPGSVAYAALLEGVMACEVLESLSVEAEAVKGGDTTEVQLRSACISWPHMRRLRLLGLYLSEASIHRMLRGAPGLEDCQLELPTVQLGWLVLAAHLCRRLVRLTLVSGHAACYSEDALALLRAAALSSAQPLFPQLCFLHIHCSRVGVNGGSGLPIGVRDAMLGALVDCLVSSKLAALHLDLWCSIAQLVSLRCLTRLRKLDLSPMIRRRAGASYVTIKQLMAPFVEKHQLPMAAEQLRDVWLCRARRGDRVTSGDLVSFDEMMVEARGVCFVQQQRFDGLDGREAFFASI